MTLNQNPTAAAQGWGPYLGATETLVSHRLLGRYPVKLQAVLDEYYRAIEKVLLACNYENPCDFIGSYHYRNISGLNFASKHAYGIAIDLDYGGDTDGDGDPTIDKNPHVHRQIFPGDPGFGVEWQIDEFTVNMLEAIKNVRGEPMVKWLGWAIGDTMHLEPKVGPNNGVGWGVVDWTSVYQKEHQVTVIFNDWVEGWVRGLDEEHVTKLHTAGIIEGDLQYWIDLLDDPTNAAWRYFYSRAQATTWAKIGAL